MTDWINEQKRWNLCGVVEVVDKENGCLTLWLRGFDDLQTVSITPVMPDWLLQPRSAFCTTIPRNLVAAKQLPPLLDWGSFLPQEYSNESTEELLKSIGSILNKEQYND
jgi:hypothetical protein